jgi:hypothetical protein
MVILVKTARPLQGKFDEAVAWAKQVAAGRPVKVYVPQVGDLNMIMWVQEFDNSGAMESYFNKLRQDATFKKTVAQHTGLFDTNTIQESVYIEPQ